MKRFILGKKSIVMDRNQSRAFDSWAIQKLGIPGPVLMENAGRSCAEFILEKLKRKTNPKVCIFCGTGNNGGDGFVIARHLRSNSINVSIAICGDKNKIAGDAKINLDILEKLSQIIEQLDINNPEIEKQIQQLASDSEIIVDAIFGTGLSGQLNEQYKRLIEAINNLKRKVLAVDIPSGLDCDTGIPLGAAIKANWTITFAAVKKGFLNSDTKKFTGQIFIASIGVEPAYKGDIG
jgi:NAD(P)H-hydrate epimerase